MLGVLCARPKAWLLATLSLSYAHGSSAAHIQSRLVQSPTTTILRSVVFNGVDQRRHHSSNCRLGVETASRGGGAASIWHAILPAGGEQRRRGRTTVIHHHDFELMKKGEGSWNAAWDARPARWLHNPDSGWLLFGVCACLAAPPPPPPPPPPPTQPATAFDVSEVAVTVNEKDDELSSDNMHPGTVDRSSASYKVKGVPADGRCLFRAIAHVACLRNGEAVPDENRQRELADDLRAQVVDELLRRRKETEWFIEGDFDAYVKRIQQPYVWGGEPELLMASHVLKTPISVFMIDRSSGGLSKIANYGEEYRKDEESPINVLFHGYGHYDILEAVSDQSYQKVEA